MNSSEIKCVELLKEKHCDVIKTNDEARYILEELKLLISTDNLKKFIKERVYVFPSRTKAYDWFMGERLISIEEITEIFKRVTPDKGSEALEIFFLSQKDNYIYINDEIHLTYRL